MPKPAFVANYAMREKVRTLAGFGVPQEDICNIVRCAPKTLRKRFREELDRGAAEANAMVAGYLFANAKAGSVAAQIFWMKTRGRWREAAPPSDPDPGTDAEPKSEVFVVLPDNSRDPELSQMLRDAQEKYFSRKTKPAERKT